MKTSSPILDSTNGFKDTINSVKYFVKFTAFIVTSSSDIFPFSSTLFTVYVAFSKIFAIIFVTSLSSSFIFLFISAIVSLKPFSNAFCESGFPQATNIINAKLNTI